MGPWCMLPSAEAEIIFFKEAALLRFYALESCDMHVRSDGSKYKSSSLVESERYFYLIGAGTCHGSPPILAETPDLAKIAM